MRFLRNFFITISITLLPLYIYICLYREINGINEPFNLKVLVDYLSTFKPFEHFEEFIDVFNQSLIDIEFYFNSLNFDINNAWDFAKKVFGYLSSIVFIIYEVITWLISIIKVVFDSLIYTISYVLGFIDVFKK